MNRLVIIVFLLSSLTSFPQVKATSNKAQPSNCNGLDPSGAKDSSAAINQCIANTVRNRQADIAIPCGKFLLNSALNMTNRPGLRLHGCSSQFQLSEVAIGGVGTTAFLCNTGGVCIDTTGSGDQKISDITLYLGAKGVSNPSTVGILQGRDNAGGGARSNHFCFAARQVFENFAIMDLNGLNTEANDGRGFIGVYNDGAESGAYRNFGIYTATPMVFTNSNVAGVKSPYQDLGTGCRVTMTGELLDTGTLINLRPQQVSQPNIEADGTANMSVMNTTFIGGPCAILMEGSQAVKWDVVANQQKSSGHFLCNSVDVEDSVFHVMAPGPVSFIRPMADTLKYVNNQFLFSTRGASVPLITDCTGTMIIGGAASYSAPTKARNTKVIGVLLTEPKETRAEIESSFSPASRFFYVGKDSAGEIQPHD